MTKGKKRMSWLVQVTRWCNTRVSGDRPASQRFPPESLVLQCLAKSTPNHLTELPLLQPQEWKRGTRLLHDGQEETPESSSADSWLFGPYLEFSQLQLRSEGGLGRGLSRTRILGEAVRRSAERRCLVSRRTASRRLQSRTRVTR